MFFLPLLWQWAVNLFLLPEDGDKKTAYGNVHCLLSDRLQLFISSADKSSLWGCSLHLGFVLYFLWFLSDYCMCIIPRQFMYFCICGEKVFSFTSVSLQKIQGLLKFSPCCWNDLHLLFTWFLNSLDAGLQYSAQMKADMVTRTNYNWAYLMSKRRLN